jgi:hypothetical protein
MERKYKRHGHDKQECNHGEPKWAIISLGSFHVGD